MTHHYAPHTADIRVVMEAPSFERLLAEAALVVRELVAGNSAVAAREQRSWTVAQEDRGEILYRLMRELLYRAATEGFLPAGITIDRLDDAGAAGRVLGEPFDAARHEAQPEVKAVTRHGFDVRRTGDGWRAEVVFDV